MKKIFAAIIIFVIAIAWSLVWYFPGQKQIVKYAGPVEKIRLGVETSILPAAVWVSENKGYFQEQGLDVEVSEFDSGRNALSTMLTEGGLDMVTVAQTPVMFSSFTRDDYAIIAAMVYSDDDVKVLGRQDKGIQKPSDLKGKKIGITKGSTGHFFLSLFLIRSGLDLPDVTIVDLKATDLVFALADGRVDAIVTWEPNISNARKLLDEKATFVDSKGIYREDLYFVANKDFIKNHSGTIERFLRAIEKGEQFIAKDKDESIDIVANRLKTDKLMIAKLWDIFEFKLTLDQTILACLEDEARWAIRSKLTDKTVAPNYLNYIYPDALRAVKPEAMQIIK